MAMVGMKPATTSGSGTTTTHIIHPDHLGGTNVVTDNNGELVQTLDYYPYGGIRIDDRDGSFTEQRKFIGEIYDAAVTLSYLNARYYDGWRGQFVSQDPEARDNPQKFLPDPQQLNSYSYARNNPVVFSDPTGRCVDGVTTLVCIAVYGVLTLFVASNAALLYGAITQNVDVINLGFGLNDIVVSGGSGLTPTNPITGQQRGSPEVKVEVSRVQSGSQKQNIVGQQSVAIAKQMSTGASNQSVLNLISSVYKPTDTIQGGFFGAYSNEVITGAPTKGVNHYQKVEQTLNRIDNIITSEGKNLTSGDIHALLNLLANAASEVQKIENTKR